jgi:catechol 2,3-dioxygenase-like lactoylglutathione lyase family enzyme
MAIVNGVHILIYSPNPDADRAFLRDVLGFAYVDVGHGWLIFGLPPAEVAVHPSEKNDVHEFYLLCADVDAFAARVTARGLSCSPVRDLGWGRLTQVSLPGGGKLGVYEPRHARPKPVGVSRKKPVHRVPPRKKKAKARRAGGGSRRR